MSIAAGAGLPVDVQSVRYVGTVGSDGSRADLCGANGGERRRVDAARICGSSAAASVGEYGVCAIRTRDVDVPSTSSRTLAHGDRAVGGAADCECFFCFSLCGVILCDCLV